MESDDYSMRDKKTNLLTAAVSSRQGSNGERWTHHSVFDMINRLQQDRRGTECPVMLLLLLLLMLLLLLLMLLLMVVVLVMMGVAVGNDVARAGTGEIASLLSAEEMSYQARGDRCCRRVVDAV